MQLPQSWAGARATLIVAAATAFAWLVTWVLRIDVTSTPGTPPVLAARGSYY